MSGTALSTGSPARRNRLRRILAVARRRPSIAFAAMVISFWVVVILTVNLWAPFGSTTPAGPRLRPPSSQFWFGTDELGRDLFSRVMYGARESLPIALAVIVAAVSIGTVLGALAGFFGGWLDAVIMRLADVLMAFPALLLAMVVSVGLGPGPRNAGVAVVIVWWPFYARLVRGQVLSIRSR